MVKNNTKMKIIAGEPGTGKTTRLIKDGVDEILSLRTVTIIVPTHSARQTIVDKIDDMLLVEINEVRKNALMKLRYNVNVLYGYAGEQTILIDEISMISVPILFNILYRTLDVEGAKIIGYGDIKQLPVIKGNSIIEELLRNNLTVDVWEWVKEAYNNVEQNKLVAPSVWKLASNVQFETLLMNYRLRANGYTGYTQEYIQDVIDNSIYHEGGYYDEVIIKALYNNTLIITPSHDRGAEVNESLINRYGDNFDKVAPFVKEVSGSKVYLNPDNKNYKAVKSAFGFVKEVPINFNPKKYEYTAYVVVNVAQGATVNDVLYYMGNKPLSAQARSFYTRNNLYTAITRSRNVAQLVGYKGSFKEMMNNLPLSAQARLHHVKAREAVLALFNNLMSIHEELSLDEIYKMYLKLFKEVSVGGNVGEQLSIYGIVNEPFEKDELALEFKNYDIQKAMRSGFAIDYKSKIYDAHISDVNANKALHNTNTLGKRNKAGKGYIQEWVRALSDDKLNALCEDVSNLSVRKFKAKYDKTLVSVKKALASLED